MADITEPVWRVRYSELLEVDLMVTAKLKTAWPNLSEGGVGHWLRMSMNDRMACFCRTENVVGLFNAMNSVLDPRPIVVERFVRSKKPSPKEALALYTFVRDWAVSINALALQFGVDTDVKVIEHVIEKWNTPVKKTTDLILPL